MKIGSKMQATMIFAVLLVVLINLLVVNIQTDKLANEITRANIVEKLKGDNNSIKLIIKKNFGSIKMLDGELVAQDGSAIRGDTGFVDEIRELLSLSATIFQIKGDDFVRITTNIFDKDGKRIVGTYLGKDSSAYGALMDGKAYMGEAKIQGLPYYTLYDPIIDADKRVIGIIFIGASKEQSQAIAKKMKRDSLLLIVAITSLAVIAILIASSLTVKKAITRPLSSTVGILKDISEGEGDLTNRLRIESADEIGDMANYLNLTFEKIRTLVALVKGQSAILEGVGSRLSSNMSETAASIHEVSSNIQSIKNQTLNQSASVTETSATMEQISKGIDRLNQLIEDQSSNVTESSSAIEQMMANIGSVTQTLVKNSDNIRNLADSSEAGKSVIDKITIAIRDVAKESEGLMEISQIIQDIASQTNLLAMNAAIEAAHAGETGRGFAVVADEIRKLAESSNSQTKTIKIVLKRITDSMTGIIDYSEEVIAKFATIETEIRTVASQEEGIRRAMEEQSEGSRQILEAVTVLNDITQKVRSSSLEMLSGSAQVSQEARNMSFITQEITGGMNEMASGADQVASAVNAVNDLSAENKLSIDSLINEVNKFKV